MIKELKQKAYKYAITEIPFIECITQNDLERLVQQAYLAGATENGIQWHYVKDELPPENVPLLCIRGGRIYVAWYYNSVYHDSRWSQVQKPYAWKEIVLPKESE